MPPLTIQQAQQTVDQWIKDLGVRYFSELSQMAQLTEEVGELARLVNRTYGDQSFKGAEGRADLGHEITDVLFVLICLANQTGVDLATAFQENMALKTRRDSERHKNNLKLKAR